ncbi:helix-turn-helix domain-containing protein, partial [Salmonella enterica]|uniref:helix-turn-helix domain-containing protein n=1 Tax=Salmonella enterica TaxID=28901 RepID=UPI003F5CC145
MAAIALYSFLAEHIDPTCGAVVAEQQFLADKLNVSRSTIKRGLNDLETKKAGVRIQVAGNVGPYALNPHEGRNGYRRTKQEAALRSNKWGRVGGVWTAKGGTRVG